MLKKSVLVNALIAQSVITKTIAEELSELIDRVENLERNEEVVMARDSLSKNKEIPDHVLEACNTANSTEFKCFKRQQFRKLQSALDDYRFGSVYCPGFGNIAEIDRLLDEMKEAQSIDNWG